MSAPASPARSWAATAQPARGLTEAEVAERVAAGRTNFVQARSSRSLGAILRSNLFTVFNAILLALFGLTIATGRWQNALFGLVVVANASVGVVQEVRAKRLLDSLTVLSAPHARVRRADGEHEIAREDVVADDLLVLRRGDQVVADSVVVSQDGLELDESLLTGEADPVAKRVEDEVRSGSFVVAGTGLCRVVRVGAEGYAARLSHEARRFSVAHSELIAGTNRLLRWIAALMVLIGPVLLAGQFASRDNHGWRQAVTGMTAALVGMVPEGLVLLTTLAFTVGVLSLARRRMLVQELPAVEGLARVDMLCIDKTGTLTDGDLAVSDVEPFGGIAADTVNEALALLAAGDDANATAQAIAAACPPSTWDAHRRWAFSSERKWSAVTAAQHGTWYLGAPEMLIPHISGNPASEVGDRVADLASAGHRVLLLAVGETPPTADGLGGSIRPAALVTLGEHIRPDAADTLKFFADQGVRIKVISGDNPMTVAAVSRAAGVPGAEANGVDARTLPSDLDDLGVALDASTVIGRTTPHQKRDMVRALQRRGHVVAMTGDGVNDLLALKDADIGIAMASGAPATRGVAQLVLMDSRFASLPRAVAEGRRVIANIERASNLFLVKNVYSIVLALASTASLFAYPLEPIQGTLVSTLTIGVPGMILAFTPNQRRYQPGFLRRVLRFSIPMGILVGLAIYGGYWGIRAAQPGTTVAHARTTATCVALIVSLGVLTALVRPLTQWRRLLVVTLAGIAAGIVVIPPLGHSIFLLDPTPTRILLAVGIGAAGLAGVEVLRRVIARRGGGREPGTSDPGGG